MKGISSGIDFRSENLQRFHRIYGFIYSQRSISIGFMSSEILFVFLSVYLVIPQYKFLTKIFFSDLWLRPSDDDVDVKRFLSIKVKPLNITCKLSLMESQHHHVELLMTQKTHFTIFDPTGLQLLDQLCLCLSRIEENGN